MTNYNINLHIVTNSPWPLFHSLNLFNFIISRLMYLNNFNKFILFFNLFIFLLISYQWWRDVVRESRFQGFHIPLVYKRAQFGIILFIISELFFFISFFWRYFSLILDESIELGLNFPPLGVTIFNPFNIPLLNTLVLLFSGVVLTLSHYRLISKNYCCCLWNLLFTILLGIYFTLLQLVEYYESFFIINDSFYGSIFFISTGFHGFHVCVGSIFLIIIGYRLKVNHFSHYHHFGYEAAIWYWHFVDLIWLFLFLFYYWWSF